MRESCGQMTVTLEGHETVYPMKKKSKAGLKLNKWIVDYGILDLLVSDNAQEETYGTWGDVMKKYLLSQKWTEPGSTWQNCAERHIGEWKKHFCCIMNCNKVPEKLWNFGAMYTSDVCQVIPSPSLGDRTPFEVLQHETPNNISDLLHFDFTSG